MVLRIAAAWLLATALLGAAVPRAHAQAVCAEARIEIRQRVMLERQAFAASLRVTNGLSSDINLLGIDVHISRPDGSPAGNIHREFDRIDDHPSAGASTLSFPVVIGQQSAPTIHWLLIPSEAAGGTTPEGIRYTVGATVRYEIVGTSGETSVSILPETITVLPQPKLALDYFLAEEVHGDDPFTPQVEPSIPFTLGVRVANIGHGPARSLSIETAQPEIVENLQGLLVGFEIIDAQIQNDPVAPTLLMDFGTLTAGETKVGRWRMTTTISGEFRDLEASYTHANTLGGAQTSLIDPPKSYLLTKDVLDDSPAIDGDQDEVPDFLARLIQNEIPSDFPRLYDSRGGEREVDVFYSPSEVLLSGGGASYALEFAPGVTIEPTTPFYIKIPKPTGMPESANFQVLRGDGSALPAANIWLSKSRPAQGSGWNHYFNLFDARPPVDPEDRSYGITVLNAPAPAEISGSVYIDSNENAQPDAGEPVIAEHAVQLSGVTSEGATVSQVRHTSGAGTFRFGDLQPGTYRLDVAPLEDYVNGSHSVGSAGGTAGGGWIEAIALTSSQSGTGYHFAKIFDMNSSWQFADLSLAMSASAASVTVDDDVDVTLVLSNEGPDSSGLVRTQLVIPIGWGVVSATPSAGTFDIDRTWVTPALASGAQHSLVLRLRPQVTGQFMISALAMHASEGLQDPLAGNNDAAVTIEVEEATPISLTIEPTVLPRVLVLVGCSELGDPEHPDLQTCVQAKIQTLPTLFAQVEHLTLETVTTREEFIVALRSGRSNIVWLMDSMYMLEVQDWTELSASVYDGDGLVTSDSWSLDLELMASRLLGVNDIRSIDTGATLTSSLLPTALTLGNEGAVLSNDGPSSVLGEFDGSRGGPAIVTRAFGAGSSVTLGFAIGSILPSSERGTLAMALIELIRPSERERFGALETFSIKLSAEGAGNDPYDLQVNGDGGSNLVGALPPPAQLDPNSVLWSGTFPPEGLATHFLTASLGDDGLATTLAARLEDGNGQIRLENHIVEHVLPETILLEAIALISQLPPSGGSYDYRADAIERLNTSLEHLGNEEFEDAIAWLLGVQYFGCDSACAIPSLTEEIGELLAEAYRGIARLQVDALVLCSTLSEDIVEVGLAGFVPLVPPGQSNPVGGVAFRNGGAGWQIGLGPHPESDPDSMANVNWGWYVVPWGLSIDLIGGAANLNYDFQEIVPAPAFPAPFPPLQGWTDARLSRTAAVLFEVDRLEDGGHIGAELVIDSIVRQSVAVTIDVPVGSSAVRVRRVFHAPTAGVAELAAGQVGLSFDSTFPEPSDPAAMVVRVVPGYLRCRTDAP